jgi:uncharacterized membrane protein YeaQ/YmgE (transglycosylase-associated protein family)
MNIVLWIIFGAIAGWIASIIIGRNAMMGALANIVVGIVGALIGGFIMNAFGAQGITGFNLTSLIVAILGAVVLLFLVGLVRREDIQPAIKSTRKYPLKSIVGIMRIRKNKTTLTTAVILTIASLILGAISAWQSNFVEFLIGFATTQTDNNATIINSFTLFASSNLTMTIIVIALVAVVIGDVAFEYRVTKGMYGNNEREAREIIDFIIKESENIDFTDGGKLKKILTESDLEEIREMLRHPLPEGV